MEETKPKRKFVRKKKKIEKNVSGSVTQYKSVIHQNIIPDDILNNELLNEAMSVLPSNYSFEIHKSVWRILEAKATRVALQFPDGLLRYSCIISDILNEFTGAECIVLGDATYGACCLDDFTANALGCDFIIHYGHSCLVPIAETCGITTLYVFVDIKIDIQHFIDMVKFNFPDPDIQMTLVATIQFVSSLQRAKAELTSYYNNLTIPQCKPLSPGEILGCTSPKISSTETIMYLADGRFHLESIMISNPNITAYKYDPYSKVLSKEEYDFAKMKEMRKRSIEEAKKAKTVGLILGTLGRQGSPNVLNRLKAQIENSGRKCFVVLLSEIFPSKLDLMTQIDAWVQVACPRLSIDWGYAFDKPLLNPYECSVAFGDAYWEEESYPMDFYSKDAGSWGVYY
eukprot:TRINITY_DN7239_c0_g1_i1.p1 TRINITY_DN7239_c0_g1~~TRINITY_DN7239_c0_g1_i1.p1  ORF type:complete len:412 (-),score=92.75 TRINITY_DN7239_c0_g1_i1:46-1242(-)